MNVTTSTVLPDLRASVVSVAPPKKNPLKRKTPPTTVTMVDKVNTEPHPDALNLHNLVVEAPVSTTKPGEKVPKDKVKQIKGPDAKQKVPSSDAVKAKAAQFALKLTQPLASIPPTEQNVAQTAPSTAQIENDSAALLSFDHQFIMEQLDRFVEDLFDGEVASLPISSEVISQVSALIQDMRNDSVEINDLIAQLNEIDNHMKDTKSKLVIKQLEESYEDVNKALTILQHRRLGFH